VGSISVTFAQLDGSEQKIDGAEVGRSLMEVAREHGVPGILADCGGGCACATCHVYVDEQWEDAVGKPDEIENEMLDMVSDLHKENSRLSCQIKLREDLDGLRVTVAPS
jgi:ferredoxin, 2Fe-2S